jgi:hypothetical protein
VPGPPAQAYHQIDTSRCIGCQMCYRVPSESTGPWTMEICPWNAIDLIYNPNFKAEWESILEPYYAGENGEKLNFSKLEELGYQLYLNRLIYVAKGSEYESQVQDFTKEQWSYGEGNFAILEKESENDEFVTYTCTQEGDELVDFLYRDYEHMFLD